MVRQLSLSQPRWPGIARRPDGVDYWGGRARYCVARTVSWIVEYVLEKEQVPLYMGGEGKGAALS